MSGGCLIWVTGASAGIGRALIEAVPWPGARVIGVSRSPGPATTHLAADLAGPAGWDLLEDSFHRELAGFSDHPEFIRLHEEGLLSDPGDVARRLWSLLDRPAITSGQVLDLADYPAERT